MVLSGVTKFFKGNKDDSSETMNQKNSVKNIDKYFLAGIQPKGGVSFRDKFIQKGDGYETCIYVSDYPSNVQEKWLAGICSMDDVIVVKDVSTMNKADVISSLNKSIVEHDTRYNTAKKHHERKEALNAFEDADDLFNSITSEQEVVKLINLRLFVHDRTIAGLEQKVNDIMNELTASKFDGKINLNESKQDWLSLFLPYDELVELQNKREGQEMPAETLAAGLPYNFSELNDRTGSYLGTTFSGGNVLFDLFHKDTQRRFYNGVCVGTMGSGKSTLLKKIAMENHARNNFIRGFDVVGEFEKLVEEMHGKMVSLDGTQGIINPLEVFKTVRSGEEGEELTKEQEREDDADSFKQHIAKISVFYTFLSGNPDDAEIKEFKRLLREFYDSLGFFNMDRMITELNADEYPIFEDFLKYVRERLYEDGEQKVREDLSNFRSNHYEKIELVIEDAVNNYGDLFNGATSIPSFEDEQVVMFSIRALTSYERGVFNAQMHNALSMIWDNLITIGAPQLKMSNRPDFDKDKATHLLVLIDEAHHLINSDNKQAVDFIIDFAREARKYFGGLLFASQSINDFVPEGSEQEILTKIKTLFSLTQYKFIMHQDKSSENTIAEVFGSSLTESERAIISNISTGQCVLSISGVENFLVDIEISDEEERLFSGGI